MSPRQRSTLLASALAALVTLAGCASSGGHGTSDDPGRDDESWRTARAREEAQRDERDRVERNTPSRELEGAAYPVGWDRRGEGPGVRVWLDGGASTYRRGERVRALFRLDDDAYVTIVRIDTDGRLRVLYPRAPHQSSWARGGHSYRVPGSRSGSFVVDDPIGLGFVFAITSYQRFDYSRVSYRRAWDYRAIGYRVTGDPFVAVRRFADMIATDDQAGYATAYDEYHVERRVDYPRSACYDCHAAGTYPVRDPYGHPCPRYRVVVYHDPYYYPYRHYPGTRVIYAPRPRYEFKPAGAPAPAAGGSRGGAGSDVSAATGVEHRRRLEDVDLRRPGAPTTDPNVVARPTRGAGATRPGDDVKPNEGGGRRGVEVVDGGPPEAPRDGLKTPRREGENHPGGSNGGNGGGNGGSVGGGATPGSASPPDDRRPGPRRDPGGESVEGHGTPGRPAESPRRGDDDERRGGPGERSGRRGEGVEGARRSDSRRDERRPEPQPETRVAWPGGDAPRSAPRGAPPSERRSEPRSEPPSERRSEPRSEPSKERRTEPRAERRDEPRSEPKREERTSTPSRRRRE